MGAIAFTALEAQFGANAKPFIKASKLAGKQANTLGATFKKLAGLAAAAFATKQLIAFGAESVRLAGIQEQAEAKITQALRVNNEASEENIRLLKEQASAIQSVTTTGDEMALGLFAVGRSLGIEVEQLKRATMAALDLSAATGMDAKSAMLALSKAATGNIQTLQRYGIQVERNADGLVDFGNVLTAVESKVSGQAEAMAKTNAGALEQMSNLWGDFKENIGNTIISIIQDMQLLEKGKEFLSWLQDATKDWESFDTAMSEALGNEGWLAFKATAEEAWGVTKAIGETIVAWVAPITKALGMIKEIANLTSKEKKDPSSGLVGAPKFEKEVAGFGTVAEGLVGGTDWENTLGFTPSIGQAEQLTPSAQVQMFINNAGSSFDEIDKRALVEAVIRELKKQGWGANTQPVQQLQGLL